MANLKNITDIPVVESAEGLNLIVNDNGAAKQIAASAVGAQADWAETDASNPAFIKNKPDVALRSDLPVEELDLDVEITISAPDSGGNKTHSYIVNHVNTFENIKNKMVSGENLKYKVKFIEQVNADICWYISIIPKIQYLIEAGTECIYFGFVGYSGYEVWLMLNPDDTVVDDT